MKKSLFALLFLCGCASATPTYTSDGKPGYGLTCSGAARSWGMCYEKAGELCGTKGYVVLEKSGEQGAIANVNASGGFASTTNTRTMIIRCKK
jgi:hypothetical protein